MATTLPRLTHDGVGHSKVVPAITASAEPFRSDLFRAHQPFPAG